ncbi:hypothetical protein D3C75_1147750 [compost metagenome]
MQGLQGGDIDHLILAAADAKYRHGELRQPRVQREPLGRWTDLRQGGLDKAALAPIACNRIVHFLIRHFGRIEIDKSGSAFYAGTVIVDKRVVTRIQ